MNFFKNALNVVDVILNWSASQPWGGNNLTKRLGLSTVRGRRVT